MMVACAFAMTACGGSKDASEGENAVATTIELSEETEELKVARLGVDIKIAPIIVASELGYYKEEGLNVSFEQVADLATGLTSVSTGDLDVLPFGSIPSCSFISQGTDVVIFAGTIAEGSECITLAKNVDKYKDAEDFIGAKIGCFRMETGYMVMKGWLREQGVDVEKDVEWLYLDSAASEVEAVRKGEVDMCFVNSGYGYVAHQNEEVAVAFQVGEYVENFPCCRMTTNRADMNEKASALVKFTIANLRAYEVIQNNKETAIECLVNYSGQPAEYVENVIYGTDAYDPAMIIDLDPSTKAVADFYETMKLNGDIDANTAYDINDYMDTSIYENALLIMMERDADNALWSDLYTSFEKKNK